LPPELPFPVGMGSCLGCLPRATVPFENTCQKERPPLPGVIVSLFHLSMYCSDSEQILG
jgi:hypothetical protein